MRVCGGLKVERGLFLIFVKNYLTRLVVDSSLLARKNTYQNGIGREDIDVLANFTVHVPPTNVSERYIRSGFALIRS
jgi:hypothetical protein